MARKVSLNTLFKNAAGKTSHTSDYFIDKSKTDEVVLDIQIGDTGQSGVSNVVLDDEKILTEVVGSIKKHVLGTNKSLNGKFLEVTTIISDVSKKTNLTTFDFKLTGGIAPFRFAMEKTVQKEGESVGYKMTIFFANNA